MIFIVINKYNYFETMNIKTFLISIFILLSIVARAENITIHGKVIDNENQPLEFVTVKIAGTAIGAQTNMDGDYTLTVAQQDTITVTFTYISFKEESRQLINAIGDITLNMKMTPFERELGAIEFTEFRRQTNTMQQIDSELFQLSPDVSGGGIEAMLTTMAGVNSTNEMSSQYSVRGGSYDENSVYINGIEIYRPQLISSGQQEGLSVINPDLVDAVEFSTGGFSAEYGDKMSSALDIRYREPQAFEGSLSLSFMGGSLAVGQSSSKFSQIHGIRYKSNSSLLASLEEDGEYDPKYFDYQTNLTYKLNQKLKFRFWEI